MTRVKKLSTAVEPNIQISSHAKKIVHRVINVIENFNILTPLCCNHCTKHTMKSICKTTLKIWVPAKFVASTVLKLLYIHRQQQVIA
jgi:hypothetical protein